MRSVQVRTCVYRYWCVHCVCLLCPLRSVNNAVNLRIAAHDTAQKGRHHIQEETSSYFSHRFHISAYHVTQGNNQFSLGVTLGLDKILGFWRIMLGDGPISCIQSLAQRWRVIFTHIKLDLHDKIVSSKLDICTSSSDSHLHDEVFL